MISYFLHARRDNFTPLSYFYACIYTTSGIYIVKIKKTFREISHVMYTDE